jgi:hypothetical protein
VSGEPRRLAASSGVGSNRSMMTSGYTAVGTEACDQVASTAAPGVLGRYHFSADQTNDMTPAYLAVENEDLTSLRELLDSGMTLLQHAVDIEIDGHTQTGLPLHVDVTAYLLARGADPLASPVGGGVALPSTCAAPRSLAC